MLAETHLVLESDHMIVHQDREPSDADILIYK